MTLVSDCAEMEVETYQNLSSLMWALPTVTEENCLKSGFLPPNESTGYCEINSSLMSSFVVPAAESV